MLLLSLLLPRCSCLAGGPDMTQQQLHCRSCQLMQILLLVPSACGLPAEPSVDI